MKRIDTIILLLMLPLFIHAQQTMTLTDAIEIAKRGSYASKSAGLSFLSSYWSFRQYKASWLPSLNLSGNLMNYVFRCARTVTHVPKRDLPKP